jgi:Peptidase M66
MDISKLLDSPAVKLGLDESVIQRLRLFISGIEVTQAVQFFEADQHLTDPADRQADNALRLVSGKPAWVRVYVGSLFGGSGVTGSLEVQRRQLGFWFVPVATLNPHSSSTTSVPSLFTTTYASVRGSIGSTINFVIPASEMIGTLRLIARVTQSGRTVEATIDVAVTLRQTLRLAGVMISYNGPSSMQAGSPNLTLAAPTLADLQAMSGTALTLFPVESTAAFRVAGTLTQTVPLQSASFPTSGCGTAWDALHAQVATVRTADGNRPGWIYYGLLPAGTPRGPVGGCGGGGVAVGPINEPWTLAHEAGHAAGLEHAPSGGAPNPDQTSRRTSPTTRPAPRRGTPASTASTSTPAT